MPANKVCNACGGDLTPWLYMPIDAKKNKPIPYASVLRCTKCKLGVLSPVPEAAAIPAFYLLDSYYTHGKSHIEEQPSSFADRVLIKLAYWADKAPQFAPAEIAKLLPSNGRVCDLGCGDANYLRQFKKLGFEVVGVDPDPAARDKAAKGGITVEIGTGEHLPEAIAGSTFDLVIMTHSLEHCRDPRAALENASRLTKPGGYCYIEVPNCASEHFKTFTICSEMFDAPRHIYFFTPDALQSLMISVGFTPERSLFLGYLRNFTPNWRGWEATIADRVTAAEPDLRPKRHDFAASMALFLRSFWRKPEEKYDSIGHLMKRAVV